MTSNISPILGEKELQNAAAPLNKAWTLPPGAYTDPEVFKAEVANIFDKDWICVARKEQLKEAGDYICFDLPHQPIVIVKDLSGEILALSRVCLHRAMPIVEGAGNTKRFTCPYHSWNYELDGSLRSAPMMQGVEGFKKEHCTLPRFNVEIWQGFIFVSCNKNPEPLGPQLEKFSALIDNYDFERLEVIETLEFPSPYNWKILVENFLEAYHHLGIHKTTFQPTYPAKDSFIEDNDDKPWSMLRMPGRPPENGQEEVNVFPKLAGARLNELFAACVYPNLLLAASAHGAFWYQLEPLAHDKMRLRIHALAFPEVAEAMNEKMRNDMRAGVSFIHEEDIFANEGVWKGLQAGSTKQGRLSLFEKSIWQVNRLWLARMQVK
jgi:phenylpropionate dioxygenase-like ring-hydroxylating dioxygenase large terminal subunit